MSATCENLFVYGTLLSNPDHPVSRLLRRHARRLGTASISGRLYDFGAFPGAVPSGRRAERIYGEVYALRNPAQRIWHALDRYEGCAPEDPEPHLFRRQLVEARLDMAHTVKAWVYFYNRPTGALRPVPGGRYRGALARRERGERPPREPGN